MLGLAGAAAASTMLKPLLQLRYLCSCLLLLPTKFSAATAVGAAAASAAVSAAASASAASSAAPAFAAMCWCCFCSCWCPRHCPAESHAPVTPAEFWFCVVNRPDVVGIY